MERKIYACNPTTLISALDNGTGTLTTTTLRTLTGNNAFRGLAFSPTKSTVGLGSFNPPAGNISSNTVNNKLFAFAFSAEEGNIVMKKITVTNTGTANLNTDFSAFRLVFDSDSNGTISPSERSASTTVTGTVSGSDVVFPGLTFSYVNQSSSGSYIIEADVTAAPISGNTLSLKIDKNNTINSNNYTTNLLNAGGSLVTMFGNAVSLTGNPQTINGLTPAITISSLNPAVPAGSITQNTANNVIYSFNLAVITANATLSGLQITTAGSYAAADLTNLKAWYSADNTFDPGTDALLSTKTTSLGAGLQVFPGWVNQLINFGSTGYIFITTDIPCSATSGNTINVNAVTVSDLTFISGNLYGSAFAGGTKTFQSAIPANVTVPSGTGGDAQVTLNWTNPTGCYNEIMITASTGTITTAPAGDGSAYTYNLHYGSGTPFGAGYVVYKGSATGQIVTGLTNGIPYYFKFFTRNGTSWSAGTEINVTPVTDPTLLSQSNFNSVIIPQIMSCGGTTRLPVVIRATLVNLVPNKLYRYYSSGSAFTDLGSTSVGAGNPMFINPDSANFRYTTSTSLTTAGGYDVFRANGSGTYTGWFSIVNTANARFTAGKYIIPSIAIGDSLGALVSRNALNDSIKVVNFSTNSADSCATGIYGISAAFPKNIVSVYDNTVGTGRPLSQTYLEDEGVTVASIVAFYSTNVNAQNGRWGSVIPNNNANGVRRIEQRDKITGSLMSFNTDADGLWQSGANTVNPSGGLTPVALQVIDAPLLDYAVLVSPANNAVNQSLSLTLDWNTVSYANSYRVQFAADSAFTTAILDSVLIADSIHIQGLSNGSVYWWRVAGITTTGTAPFGSAFSFTTIPSAPVAPVLFTPANNSTGNPLNLNLVWSKSQFAIGYNVLLATDAGFTNIIINDSLLTDSVKILTNLAPLTNYYWKVRAKNAGGWSNFSSVFTFKTIGVPTTVTLYSPSNNAVN